MTSYAITKFRGGRTWSHVHKILLTRFLNYWFSIEFLRVCPLRVFLHLRVKDWAKPLDQTPLNPGIFAAFAPILYGWSRCWSKWQREPNTPDPRLRSKRHYGSDSVEAGWDHHLAHSSVQGMTIDPVIFSKRWRHVRPTSSVPNYSKTGETLLVVVFLASLKHKPNVSRPLLNTMAKNSASMVYLTKVMGIKWNAWALQAAG